MNTQTCRTCRQTLPATIENFYAARSGQGLRSQCRPCYAQASAACRAARRGRPVVAASAPASDLSCDVEALTFGVEIETFGISFGRAAQAIQSVVGGTCGFNSCTGADGRVWKAVRDGSIQGSEGCEVVSPVLKGSADIETLQQVVRALRRAGARVNESCGVHVHVGLQNVPMLAVARTVRFVDANMQTIWAAHQVGSHRHVWCHRSPSFWSAMTARMGRLTAGSTFNDMASAWYGQAMNERSIASMRGYHYHESRYHGVNLHAAIFHGTVEFRWFAGTLHAGKVRTYVEFCLALVARGHKVAESPRRDGSEASVQALIADLGLTGARHNTARHHMLAAFPSAQAANAVAALEEAGS